MLVYHQNAKMSLRNVLDIGMEHLDMPDPLTMDDIPMNFLRKIIALNRSARNTQVSNKDGQDIQFDHEEEDLDGFHPLDVLSVLLHCSDSFLQQEILTKMEMCRFGVPLLLPAVDASHCTFMLWAMRDIVKKWRPQELVASKGFREDSLVSIPMPIFSFVRLGRCGISKSKILNKVLEFDQVQQHNDFFVHEDMECGNINREISDGLLEIAWHFPAGTQKRETFVEPFGVTNLRGDIQSHLLQFDYLTQISAAVFIFIENVDGGEPMPTKYNSDTEYYFIVNNPKRTRSEVFLKTLFPLLDIDRRNIIIKSSSLNDAMLVNRIKSLMMNCFEKPSPKINLEDMAGTASELGFGVDTSHQGCCMAESKSRAITSKIGDLREYKAETMKLQGEPWKQLTKLEKELCKRKQQGREDQEMYKNQLTRQCIELRKEQNQRGLTDGMSEFISAVTDPSHSDRQFFIKWMKFKLDSITRASLCDLQAKYEELCNDKSSLNHAKIKQLDQQLCDSALGIEHFMREMGQLYEAEYHVMENDNKTRRFIELPGIAADLLLDGIPLELIDGDASNIPVQWVTDVLKELDAKTGGQCKIRVISVLGVQSTGKSTLLNTMFGLQFPVSSGRCTRGAFMTLLTVKEDLYEELGCQFIMVIDTEGLKAQELASLEGSYEHDNELATLVVGLSDITIVNISKENTSEMKDILQIVIHAFLRMKDIKRKPNCHFVHQNVSDISAHTMTMRDKKKFLDLLNEITELAAKMEKRGKVTFNDIMVYDLKEHNWYIPGLWQGIPPMAPINSGYSEAVFGLKKYLLEYMKKSKFENNARHIWEFLEWIKTLWNAVKYENFIFSFRNSLVAEAHRKLCMEYLQWNWTYSRQVHLWLTDNETKVKNMSPEKLQTDINTLRNSLEKILQKGEIETQELLKNYFDSKPENVHLLESYRENFRLDIIHLRKELEQYATSKLEEAVRIQKGKNEMQKIKDTFQDTMDGKVTGLLKKCIEEKRQLGEEELEMEFDAMWRASSLELRNFALRKRNVNQEMMQQLIQDMSHKASFINQKLLGVKCLDEFSGDDFRVENVYFEVWDKDEASEEMKHECFHHVHYLAVSLIDQCRDYVEEKICGKKDFDDRYSKELLDIIDRGISKSGGGKFNTTADFELDIKLKIMGNFLQSFQKMHDAFIQENDPACCLDQQRPKYFSVFKSIFQQKDEEHRAKEFCEFGLKPAIKEYIDQHLGEQILNDLLCSGGSEEYSSQSCFQFTVLKKLLLEKDFSQYLKYINSYEGFVKKWIWCDLEAKYDTPKKLEAFQLAILHSIMEKINAVLQSCTGSTSISDFLNDICTKLQDDLVIPRDVTRLVLFHTRNNIPQFAEDIDVFVAETQEQLESEIESSSFESVMSTVTLKPQDVLFRKVVGCRKQCPFCKVPCEVIGVEHQEHFSTMHRPKGLASCTWKHNGRLATSTCSLDVISDKEFQNKDTNGEPHPYMDYRAIYPDWCIEGDLKEGSDYWKYVFKEFNRKFADAYLGEVAQIPDDWKNITYEDAMRSLEDEYNVNEGSHDQ